MIYLDTSALIKRFVNEEGSLLVRSIVQGKEAVATAKIAYAESTRASPVNSGRTIWLRRSMPWLVANLKAIGQLIFAWS